MQVRRLIKRLFGLVSLLAWCSPCVVEGRLASTSLLIRVSSSSCELSPFIFAQLRLFCSGGWDWAPVGNTNTRTGASTFSKGIFKSIYLIPVSTVAITHVTPLVFYNGSYPAAPLTDATAGPWTVRVRVDLETSTTATGTTAGVLTAAGAWPGGTVTLPVTISPGNSSFFLWMVVPAGSVNLWWPTRLGAQAMYDLNVSLAVAGTGATLSATRSFGFRIVYMITTNATSSANIANSSSGNGSGDFTMRLRVNGADIWARGANFIPTDEMEGRVSPDTYYNLIRSVADGGMNTLRIWGGGLYYHDAFYDACDRAGILIYHDMAYVGDGHQAPNPNALETAELEHNLRRLGRHPSIALWNACNECGGGGIWDSFLMTTVAIEDPSRPVWPASPSYGWLTGVDSLTGLPNGEVLKEQTSSVSITSADAVVAGGGERVFMVDGIEVKVWSAPCSATEADASAAGANCTFFQNFDYDNGYNGKTAGASTAQECCDACAADPANCYAASWSPAYNMCWFKPSGAKFTVEVNVTSCFPPGSAPPPIPLNQIEMHGPYQHGGGFPALDGYNLPTGPGGPWAADIPVTLAAGTARGAAVPGLFTAEFGASVWSSFESTAGTVAPEHWGLHGGAPADNCTNGFFSSQCWPPEGGNGVSNVMAQRNYPCDNFLLTYFGGAVGSPAMNALNVSLNNTGEDVFKSQLYMCTMAQAMFMTGVIENHRSDNCMGALVWQLNEVWPTGGWGSLEYGNTGFTPGQVTGGRWKPLHHMMSQHLFNDQIAVCGNDGRCFVRNDDPINAFTGSLQLSLVHLPSGAATAVSTTPINLAPGLASFQWLCLGTGSIATGCQQLSQVLPTFGCSPNGTDCILLHNLTSTAGVVADLNYGMLSTPGVMAPNLPPTAAVTALINGVDADGNAIVTVTASGGPALLIQLLTLAQGRFSVNAFHLIPSSATGGVATQTVLFHPFGPLQMDILSSSLRVEHAGMYL